MQYVLPPSKTIEQMHCIDQLIDRSCRPLWSYGGSI